MKQLHSNEAGLRGHLETNGFHLQEIFLGQTFLIMTQL